MTQSIKPWQWGLYDFANSLANVAVSFYFVLWFVENLKSQDYFVSLVVALVTIILLCTLPQIGARADHLGTHVRDLTVLTICSIVSLCLLSVTALSVSHPSSLVVLSVLIFYALFQYFYQASVAIYTSLLRFVSSPDEINGEVRVAGTGNALGQLGNVVGLLLALPVASMFGRTAAILSGAILFGLCSVPILLWFRRLKTKTATPTIPPRFFAAWKELRRSPDIFHYLLGYYLLADAILTLQLFLSLYLTIVARLSDSSKTLLMAGALLVGVVGAMLAKKIASKWSVKRAIEISILSWALLLALFAFVAHPLLFVLVTLLNGFIFGLLFSLSQAYYSTLVPITEQARYFGIYTVFERASSLLGPLLWSAILLAFSSYGEWRYRFAVLSLAILVLLSLVFIRKVKGTN